MATTPSTDETEPDTAAYAEQDKLGPLGGKLSIFDDPAELRRALVAEVAAAADTARDAVAAVDRDPAGAVHTYRKALRRARAVLALVADALPRSERRAIVRALREARRALGAARDQTVVPDALAAVELDESDRDTARAILSATEQAVPPVAELSQLLAEGAARAAAQVEALEASLPRMIAWSIVARGLRRTYAAARHARKDAKRSTRSFHRWRRRTKELMYQLELLAGYAGSRTADLHRELEEVADTQGAAVDLLMLRDLVRAHATGISPDAIARLAATLEAQLEDLVPRSRRAARELFRAKPRKFARRVTRRVRRDTRAIATSDELDAS